MNLKTAEGIIKEYDQHSLRIFVMMGPLDIHFDAFSLQVSED